MASSSAGCTLPRYRTQPCKDLETSAPAKSAFRRTRRSNYGSHRLLLQLLQSTLPPPLLLLLLMPAMLRTTPALTRTEGTALTLPWLATSTADAAESRSSSLVEQVPHLFPKLFRALTSQDGVSLPEAAIPSLRFVAHLVVSATITAAASGGIAIVWRPQSKVLQRARGFHEQPNSRSAQRRVLE